MISAVGAPGLVRVCYGEAYAESAGVLVLHIWSCVFVFIGVALAWFFFDGFAASPLGFSLQLAVTPPIAGLGIAWAFAMGIVGGVLPAVKAARLPVTTALRAT